jgi:hypothetical protein
MNHEEESVSEQVDHILSQAQDRFSELVSQNRMEDAIALGDEFLEWISHDPEETFLYYNEKELFEL